MAGDAWLKNYDACSHRGQKVMEDINERNNLARSGGNVSKLNAQIRSGVKLFSAEIKQLRQDLLRLGHSVTHREAENRQAMLDKLVTQEKKLQLAMNNEASASSRPGLLGQQGVTGLTHDPWQTSDDLENMNVDEIRSQQQSMIRQQDEGLEALHAVVSRQKMMAKDIGNEIDEQNELIDDISYSADSTNERLLKETRHVRIVDRKSNTCWYWVVIILLLVAILVIAVVPYNGKP